MNGLFHYDNPIWRFVGRLWDLLILNLLWLVCSLPIITVGASTTALYYCTLKIAEDRDNGIFPMFFHSFRENLRQATLLWLVLGGIGLLFYFDLRFFWFHFPLKAPWIQFLGLTLLAFFVLLWLFVWLYVFALQARFVNPVKQTLKNALLMSIRHLLRTLGMLLGDGVILAGTCFLVLALPRFMSMLVLFLGSLLALYNSWHLKAVFKNYTKEEE